MKVKGDLPPSSAFTLEKQPNKPDRVLARFYENAEPFEKKRGELTTSGYEYDEYKLELRYYDGLAKDIANNFGGYLAQAKQAETEQNTIPNLKNQAEDADAMLADQEYRLTLLELGLGADAKA